MDWQLIREFLMVMGICTARAAAACSVAPFLSTEILPGQVRNSVFFALALIVFPMVAPTMPAEALGIWTLLAMLGKEVVIGLLIGFLIGMAFSIAMSVGFFIDNQRGASMASVFDPMAGEQTSPTGILLVQVFTALFYTTGGFLFFLDALFESYAIWPVGAVWPKFDPGFPEFILAQGDRMMRMTVVLSAPVLITVLVTEFGLGLMNRFAPSLNVFSLAMPVKSLVGVIVLVVYTPTLFLMFGKELVGSKSVLEFLKGAVG